MEFNTDLTVNMLAVLPEILLVVLGFWVLSVDLGLFGLFPSVASRQNQTGYWAGIGLFLIAIVNILIPVPSSENGISEQLVLGGMLRHDPFTEIFRTMIYIAAGLTCLIAMGDKRLRYRSEFYLVIIVASMGAGLMGGAADLIMVFVALETLSILLYSMAGFIRPIDDEDAARLGSESGLKYFLLGSFASGFTLYGFSLVYGFTGHTNLYEIGQAFSEGAITQPPIILALMMVMVGFGFKISAVPFHFWTPDVYQGAPTPMTAYVSVASKAASFALLLRFLLAVFPPAKLVGGESYADLWVNVVILLAVITMTLGNVLALAQKNIKRLLAYSSIAQAGYTLVGVAAISTSTSGQGAAAVAFYMFMYVLTNILAFGCIILFTNATGSEEISDMGGVGKSNLGWGLLMATALLSLAGIPPAAGFWGKFYLFMAAVDAGLPILAIIMVLNSIIALYYYLVVIKVIFFENSSNAEKEIPFPLNYQWALGLAGFGVILLGTVLVSFVYDWASDAGLNLFVAFGG